MSTLAPGRSVLLLLAAAGLGLVALAGTAGAATLNVANNGVDSATCGPAASPCRSLSRAIQNAAPGDRIVVGPGRYGDLNRDGLFNQAGEEAAEVGSGCFCMINVNKRLTIESSAGAGATVLDAGGADVDVVVIQADNVVFGKPRKGFTLTQTPPRLGRSGLFAPCCPTGVRVAGNLAIGNSFGFFLDGTAGLLTGNLANGNSGNGFVVFGSGHVLTGNEASGNVVQGFELSGDGYVLTGNVASHNGQDGFEVRNSTDMKVTGNIASSNGQRGFVFDGGSGHVATANAIHGNRAAGVFLNGPVAVISQNNIYGNDPLGNCGLQNSSGAAITATGNFWGAATGPGPDPADNVCNSGAGSSTTTAPFATKEFKPKAKPLF